MNLVNAVLICFAIASVPGLMFGLMCVKGERTVLKKMTELDETGIEVQARLVSLVPFGKGRFAHAVYEFEGPGGTYVRHEQGATVGPAHVVGETYAFVHHPQFPKRLHMGTAKTIRKERRARARYLREGQRIALCSLAAGVLAGVGLVFGP
ncbi:hypothetical protein AB0A69_09135 [Streptomyces sp. NPDC045431]|uniref:hypothetical protein n=1 Tax=Streptomyces sp. NPDC045431 TaxID=3155613 RepID=UPI0033CC0A62